MDVVTLFACCALGTATPPSGHQPDGPWQRVSVAKSSEDQPNAPSLVDRWQPFVAEASRRFGVLEQWIRDVIRVESGGQTVLDGHPITSRAGAMGLMQVMPETYETMRLQHGLGSDPYDPHDNVLAGAAYLRDMYDRYGYPGLFAAYNAGPERFSAYLSYGRTLPEETWNYLTALGSDVKNTVLAQGVPGARPLQFGSPNPVAFSSGTGLFFTLGTNTAYPLKSPETHPAASNSSRLFVPLHADNDASLAIEKTP